MSQDVHKCDFCGKPAATFLQYIIDGEVQTASICEECMRQNGIDTTDPETVLKAFEMLECGLRLEQLAEKCVCGTTGESAANGVVGCELCYEHFRNLLEAVWGVDSGESTMPAPGTKIERLQAQLEEAVAEERYEEAAELRDEMKRLEEGEDADEEEA